MEKYTRQEVSPVEKENERDENYNPTNPQIDTSRTKDNYHTAGTAKSYIDFINSRIATLSLKRKLRSDAIYMNSFVLTSDKGFFDGLHHIEQRNFFMDCTEFFANKYGKENIISAVVHMDETTPHLHLNIVPIVNGKLCSKDLFDKTKLSILQTEFYEKVGKKWGLERGKEGSQTKHLSTAEFKAKKIIESAEVQAAAIEERNKPFTEALEQAKQGDIARSKGGLKDQIIAVTADNENLRKQLDTTMHETLEYAKRNKELEEQYSRSRKALQLLNKLKEQNPAEYEKLIHPTPTPKSPTSQSKNWWSK
jgi:hypothetical protein